MAFERKEDCQRALAMCGKNMFLIGNSARPVVVEMARTEVQIHHSIVSLHGLCTAQHAGDMWRLAAQHWPTAARESPAWWLKRAAAHILDRGPPKAELSPATLMAVTNRVTGYHFTQV